VFWFFFLRQRMFSITSWIFRYGRSLEMTLFCVFHFLIPPFFSKTSNRISLPPPSFTHLCPLGFFFFFWCIFVFFLISRVSWLFFPVLAVFLPDFTCVALRLTLYCGGGSPSTLSPLPDGRPLPYSLFLSPPPSRPLLCADFDPPTFLLVD